MQKITIILLLISLGFVYNVFTMTNENILPPKPVTFITEMQFNENTLLSSSYPMTSQQMNHTAPKVIKEHKINPMTASLLAMLSPMIGFTYAKSPGAGIIWELIRDVSFVMGFRNGIDDETGELNSTGTFWVGITGAAIYYSVEGSHDAAEAYNSQLADKGQFNFGLYPVKKGVLFNVTLNF